MPDWASVLLPIVTGLIGLFGGLYGTWLGVAQSREQERRRTLGDVAGEFAKRIGGAAHAVGYAVAEGQSAGEPVNDAEHLVGETTNVLAPLELQFDDEIGQAARAAWQELREAITALRADHQEEARAAYERAEKRRAEFKRLARASIWRGTDWSRAPGDEMNWLRRGVAMIACLVLVFVAVLVLVAIWPAAAVILGDAALFALSLALLLLAIASARRAIRQR